MLLSDFDNPLQKYKDSKQKFNKGFVYLAWNEAWPDWVKVGRTKDTRTRLKAYQTSSPLRDYQILIKAECSNTHTTEAVLLSLIATKASEVRGEWLKINGEAIYETHPWEKSKANKQEFLFYTEKVRSVYVICTKWPQTCIQLTFEKEVENITLLGLRNEIKWTQESEQVIIHVPNVSVGEVEFTFAFVFKIEV